MKVLRTTESFRITVLETGEQKVFLTLGQVGQWKVKCRRTLELWGGKPTFRIERTIVEEIEVA